LCVVLYRCGTWPLTLREEHRLKLFDKRMLRRISGSKREETEAKELNNEFVRFIICKWY
jgi:hypothetical protein